MTTKELGHIKRVQVMKTIREAGKVLTREIILGKVPKKIVIKYDYNGYELMSSWWYKRMKGRIFEVKLIHGDPNHYEVINDFEEITGNRIFKKHAKVIA